jgi:DNA-binding SARP family transcriptional activator
MWLLRTLGGLALERDGVPIEGPAVQPSRLAVLAVLARAGSAGMSRDKLQALLWPEKDAAHASGALRQSLYTLRRALTGAILGGRTLRLTDARIASDVGRFVAGIQADDLENAESWYRGPFLDGFFTGSDPFERWAEREREELAHQYAATLERLAMRADSAHAAVVWWRRLVALDPVSPRTVVRLMEALVRDGDRFAAIRCAREHARRTLAEFGATPDTVVQTRAHELEQSGRGQWSELSATSLPRPIVGDRT